MVCLTVVFTQREYPLAFGDFLVINFCLIFNFIYGWLNAAPSSAPLVSTFCTLNYASKSLSSTLYYSCDVCYANHVWNIYGSPISTLRRALKWKSPTADGCGMNVAQIV